MKNDGKFRHESLQTRKTIKSLLEAVTKGIGKGELTLSDEDGEIRLEPEGLLTLRVQANRNDGNCRLDMRITWSDADAAPSSKSPPKAV